MSGTSISDLERKLEDLPMLPTVVARLLSLNSNDENFFEEIVQLAHEDPPFALRIIKLSNSASSAPTDQISSLEQAVARIGTRSITNMVTSAAVTRVFLPSTQGEKNLWAHSIQVAVASRIIAQTASSLAVDPQQAYLCGLLHDIGRFVLFDNMTEEMNQVEESDWSAPKQLVEVELETYGFSHAELGSRICKKWGLPDIAVSLTKYHHEYDLHLLISKNDPTLTSLVTIVQVADAFSVFMIKNPDAFSWEPEVLKQTIAEQCIHPLHSNPPITGPELHDLAQQIWEESEAIRSGLGIGS